MSSDTFARLSSRPGQQIRAEWGSGAFESATREKTAFVEGTMRSDRHLIMVTTRGGAGRHRFRTEDGLVHDAPDRAGSASFLPAGCARKLELTDVGWSWAMIALPAGEQSAISGVRSFTVAHEPFLWSMLSEMERVAIADKGLDTLYASTMGAAAWSYVNRRYFGEGEGAGRDRLPAWRLRKVRDYVDERLGDPISISDLARVSGLSERHFYRAFRATTGMTPLQMVQERRIEAAKSFLLADAVPVCVVANRVGFVSTTHFARVFKARTRMLPGEYRVRGRG